MKEAVAALMVVAAGELPGGSLDAMRWQARPVLVFAADDDPRLDAQLALFDAAAAEMHERRNVVVVDTGSAGPLRARFQPDGFTVVLVGLDGGEKFRRGDVVDPAALSSLIDTMPMRRRSLARE